MLNREKKDDASHIKTLSDVKKILLALPENERYPTIINTLSINFTRDIVIEGWDLINFLGCLEKIHRDLFLKEMLGGNLLKNVLNKIEDIEDLFRFSPINNMSLFITKTLQSDHINRLVYSWENLILLLSWIDEKSQITFLKNTFDKKILNRILTCRSDLEHVLKSLPNNNRILFLSTALSKEGVKLLILNAADLSTILWCIPRESHVSFIKDVLGVNYFKILVEKTNQLNEVLRATSEKNKIELKQFLLNDEKKEDMTYPLNKTLSTTPSEMKKTPEYELNSILKQYQTHFDSNGKKLRQAIPTNELWRFFVDGWLLQNEESWLTFEKREPGYLLALAKAFSLLFDPNASLTAEFIKKLHFTSTEHVKNLNYDNDTSEDKKGDFRKSIDGRWGFPLKIVNTTKEGINEIVADLQYQTETYTFSGINIHPKKGHTLSDEEIKILEDDTQLNTAKKIFESLGNHKMNYYYTLYSKAINESSYYNQILAFIEHYEKNINAANTALDKLSIIVKFIANCERLHPFIDANCRTFCMLLVNFLLIKNGFPLVIQDNPNRFEGYSTGEMTNELINGMNNTFSLIEKKLLHNVKTDDILQQATHDEKKYFHQVMDYEQNNRSDTTLSIYKSVCFFTDDISMHSSTQEHKSVFTMS